ncbi:LysM peptidoglycan-binding domain-containing protein [Mucilaginibacter sp. UYCu711]|uniref:DPBB and LysM peptidoglycan-binding domain-containing protein n=1 Tax=Mucilaginibacter sp. UYCu711 TaxID=3156339 RepID=UPI003D226D1B
MKLKTLLLLTSLLTASSSLLAKNRLIDSVGVENLDGKKVILHKLDPKDNYYSIGRRYDVKPGDIIKFNNNAPLKIGGIIKVPTDRSFVETTKPNVGKKQVQVILTPPPPAVATQQQPVTPTQSAANTSGATQTYKVSAGETLYAIAKRFNSTVEDITKLNNLTSTTVSPGQVLQVKSGTADVPAPVVTPPVVATRDSTNPPTNGIDSAERKLNANRYGLFEKNEKGVATWIDDTSLDPAKKLVLHRTAPIGTVIKITNPMSNRTTFAKVVGRFSDNETTKDVILIMTKNVAESIGALDKRIHVTISYGTPPNE